MLFVFRTLPFIAITVYIFSKITNLSDSAVTCEITCVHTEIATNPEFLMSVLCIRKTSRELTRVSLGIQLSYAHLLLHRLSAVLNLLNLGVG